MTALSRGLGGGRIKQKEEGLMDMDNSVVIAGGRGMGGGGRRYGWINGNGKNTIKKKTNQIINLHARCSCCISMILNHGYTHPGTLCSLSLSLG